MGQNNVYCGLNILFFKVELIIQGICSSGTQSDTTIIKFTNPWLHLNKITSQTSANVGIRLTHHMACTETGLKTCERPAVFTLKPLRKKGRRRGVSEGGGLRWREGCKQ